MYTSVQTFQLTCAVGTGASVSTFAVAESVISQTDADNKAAGLARALAVEQIVCVVAPTPAAPIYYSVSQTASANNTPGHVTETFTVTLPAGSVYSTVSQAEADAAAATAAQVQANLKRDANQRLLYYNTAQSYAQNCGDGYLPATYSATVTAGTISSEISAADANATAYANAVATVAALIAANCVAVWYSTVQSYTATCGGGLVGNPVTVTNPAGYSSSSVSQAAADAASLAAATAAAKATIVCAAGFYNTSQSYTATCLIEYGTNWIGSNSTYTVAANTLFSTVSQADADAHALALATTRAIAALSCHWGGGMLP